MEVCVNGLGGDGFLFPWFFRGSTRLLGVRMPISGQASAIGLSTNGRTQICCRALSAGGVTDDVIAEEFKFKPMFDEYVKVMESVSFDRRNSSWTVANGHSSGRRSSRTFEENSSRARVVDKNLKNVRGHEAQSRDTYDGNFGSHSSAGKNDKLQTEGNRNAKPKYKKVEKDVSNEQMHPNRLRKVKFSGIVRQNDTLRNWKPKEPIGKVGINVSRNVSTGISTVQTGGECVNHEYASDLQNKEFLPNQRKGVLANRKTDEMIDEQPISKENFLYKGKFVRNVDKHVSRAKFSQEINGRKLGKYQFERDCFSNTKRHNREYEYGTCSSITKRDSGSKSKTKGSGDYAKRDLKISEKSSLKENICSLLNVDRFARRQKSNYRCIVDTGEASKAVVSDKRFSKHEEQSHMFPDEEEDQIDFEDRAAFKIFEVFTDVRNRPRVLRMELEERIQHLAKWLNATDINMPAWQFSKMMHNAKIKFTDHSILRVVQILGEFGNWKRVLQIVEWLQSRERFKSYKSKYIYTAVINVLGKARRPREALNIFYAMRQEKASYPDLAAYHCISVCLGQAGHMKELFDVIDCMKSPPRKKLGNDQKWDPRLEPDLVIYHAVLNACIQQKQWEGAFWVLQQLKQKSLRPTGTTYGLVMEVMLACGKYDLVHEFFKKVEKKSIPSALSFKVLVNAFWREGKIDEAVFAVQDMERRGIVGPASIYYDLARCLCSAGRCREALMQIDKICKVANKPLVVTYTGLIQACLDSGSIQNGIFIFYEMCRVCSPNIVTCNIMLKSFLEHEMYDKAKDLFQKILDGSHDINKKTDLRGKVVPDKFAFNTMMDASVAAENWDDFENIYVQMLRHGYHFDKKRHLRMVMDAARAGKVKVLETTWEYLVQSGRDLPPPIIKERFRMKLREDDCGAAISCINVQLVDEQHALSKQSLLNLLKFNSDSFNKDTIFRMVHEMENLLSKNVEPLPLLQNLLDACLTFLASSSAMTT